MDRRGFLQNLMIGAAALTVDPERLLWTPGRKKIFIPSPLRRHRFVVPIFMTDAMLNEPFGLNMMLEDERQRIAAKRGIDVEDITLAIYRIDMATLKSDPLRSLPVTQS